MARINKERVRGFQNVMETFLNERLEAKLKPIRSKLEKEEEHEKRTALQEKHDSLVDQYSLREWLRSAASKCASQMRVATHVLKATNSSAKGTNFFCPPDSLSRLDEVASGHLGDDFAVDFCCNANLQPEYEFLQLEYEDKFLFEWLNLYDEDLCAAFGGDEQAKVWFSDFRLVFSVTNELISHTKTKQIYWLVGDDPTEDSDFILFSPMYSSSLAHRVFLTVDEHKNGEKFKEARAAKKKEQHSGYAIHEYPNMGIQKIGGSHPKNVSQLNRKRGGRNYLFASLPPVWTSQKVYPRTVGGRCLRNSGSVMKLEKLLEN